MSEPIEGRNAALRRARIEARRMGCARVLLHVRGLPETGDYHERYRLTLWAVREAAREVGAVELQRWAETAHKGALLLEDVAKGRRSGDDYRVRVREVWGAP